MKRQQPTVLILGIDGMLGHTLFNFFLKNENFQIFGTSRKKTGKNIIFFDYKGSENELVRIIKQNNINYIINCIARLKNTKKSNYEINYKLPLMLDKLSDKLNIKLIHISTDDVFPYLSGTVNENSKTNPANEYGESKLKGEIKSINSLTIRTSLIGFSDNKSVLLEWVKNSKKPINGFINQKWSGCTTLQFAKFCKYLISENNFINLREKTSILHFTPLGPLSKYSIIKSEIKILKLKTKINKINSPQEINRILTSLYLSKTFLLKFGNNVDLSLKELYKFENK